MQTYAYSSFVGRTSRVSSGRSGPQRWYVPSETRGVSRWQPELTDVLYESVTPEMIQELERRPHRKQRFQPPAVKAILNKLEIGDRIKTEQYSPYHSMIYIRDNVIGVESNITDIGYGASQVLPVLAACTQFSQSLLVIEQPEIHLHPKAQGTVAEVICATSKNRQVIIETHSPHMINRARIMVAKGLLGAQDVAINYVYRDKNGSHVKSIPIQENGDFGADWPSGFFDERYEDTMTLLQLKSTKE